MSQRPKRVREYKRPYGMHGRLKKVTGPQYDKLGEPIKPWPVAYGWRDKRGFYYVGGELPTADWSEPYWIARDGDVRLVWNNPNDP